MKRYAVLSLLIFALFTMLIIGGCAKNSPTEPDQEGEQTELDQPYGGFNASDELPAFGDPALAADFEDDDNPGDPITLDPAFINAVNSDTVKAYFIRITWGLLQYDSTATDIIDWSGSAAITRGRLAIMKTVRFEPGDYLILPRPDQKTVNWVSYTAPSFDGIVLVIIDRDTLKTQGKFTFTTSQYSKTFSYDELDSLAIVATVTPQGHQVSIQAYNKQVIPFGGGFLDGRWIKTREHGGIFKGRWINEMGTRVGHLNGIWGVNRLGAKVFFGKYINLTGRFAGLLAGTWGYDQNDQTAGWLTGRWIDRSLTAIGTLRGHWKTKQGREKFGFFHGKWKRTN